MDIAGKRVLVTGAAGFIGSHLCEALLERGAQLRAMVRYNSRNTAGWLDRLESNARAAIDLVRGDVRDARFVANSVADREVVFHLAALIGIPYSYVAPQSYVEVNIAGTLNVLEACRDHGVDKLVHTSTSETYGTAQTTPMTERHPEQPQSPYAATKLAADKLALTYHTSFDLPVSVLRPFNTYGPRQSMRAVIPTIIQQALAGAEVIKLGALDPVRDFTFVGDTAAGFIAAAESAQTIGQVTHLGTGRGVSIGELAATLLRLCESDARIEVDAARIRPARSEVMELLCDASQAQQRCGWSADVSLEDGLRRTIAFIRQHPELRVQEYVV